MEREQVTALGFMLSTYHSDLTYFLNFVRFSKREISVEEWCDKNEGTFKNFIDEFRVARNADKGKTIELLLFAKDWFDRRKHTQVDELAESWKANKLTHHFIARSLASKVMMLMCPQEILPLDGRAKKALRIKNDNTYSNFSKLIKEFQVEHKNDIQESLIDSRI